MRRTLPILSALLVLLGLPALPAGLEATGRSPVKITRIIRSGTGEPRVRDSSAARTASPRSVDQLEATGRTRPYQVPMPGEGAPKG
jgi:hypothetical protein